ncbi:hypothetical protein NQ317_017746 [Molorchus minor]|uniref:Uncharacterized protein n=1 Tax=Molorchus minor TaxID=1323400 RepID=A0ABQ9J0Y7_9CUCU|nr:hypothetical protein NQ317_017746 [Molorchus minor]
MADEDDMVIIIRYVRRRRCLAEILAKNCIFMFFVEILRKYKISLLPGTEKPTGSMKSGITMSPENYKAQFTSREKFSIYYIY